MRRISCLEDALRDLMLSEFGSMDCCTQKRLSLASCEEEVMIRLLLRNSKGVTVRLSLEDSFRLHSQRAIAVRRYKERGMILGNYEGSFVVGW